MAPALAPVIFNDPKYIIDYILYDYDPDINICSQILLRLKI